VTALAAAARSRQRCALGGASLRRLRLHRDYFLYRKKPAKAEGPARKGPCPCGSGKKYKRCCGEEEGGPGEEA